MLPDVFRRDFFDDFFGSPFYDDRDMKKLERKLYGHRSKDIMKTDIKETGDAYKLEMDLPGFKKEEVKVSLENGYLTINASKNVEQSKQDKKSAKYLRRERYAGTCERSFYVGENVTDSDIKGEFKHGILKLTIAKKNQKPEIDEKNYIPIEG